MILVLGIGNTLLSDEGVGVVAMNALKTEFGGVGDITFLDGGTLSFTLAVPIAESSSLLVFDAAELRAPAGTVAIFEGDAMDRFLGENRKSSVHEVGLIDLMTISKLTERWPEKRALIGVQPLKLDWGEALTDAVERAVPEMCRQAGMLIRRWQSGN